MTKESIYRPKITAHAIVLSVQVLVLDEYSYHYILQSY